MPGEKWCSCASAAEWNVRAATPVTPSAASRDFITPAAFSVKVTARIWPGANAPGRDLVRDPPRDRRRLPGAGAGEDADRPAHRLGGAPLLGIQTVEDLHPGTLAAAPAGNRHGFPTIPQRAFIARTRERSDRLRSRAPPSSEATLPV